MLNDDQIESLNKLINDKLTVEEFCEILGITIDTLFYEFLDQVLEVDWGEIL